MKKNLFVKAMCFLLICTMCGTSCYAKSAEQSGKVGYNDDGQKCVSGNDKFQKARVVSRKITRIEFVGVEYSKWIRMTDIYRANTGRDHQSISAIPINKDKQSITISASASIPVAEFLDLAIGVGYDFSKSKKETFAAAPSTGDMKNGEYAAYYIRKSWNVYKATVETVFEYGNTFNNPSNQVKATTYEYYQEPRKIGPDDKTFIFSFNKNLLKSTLPKSTCNGYACTVGGGYDHPYAPK